MVKISVLKRLLPWNGEPEVYPKYSEEYGYDFRTDDERNQDEARLWLHKTVLGVGKAIELEGVSHHLYRQNEGNEAAPSPLSPQRGCRSFLTVEGRGAHGTRNGISSPLPLTYRVNYNV